MGHANRRSANLRGASKVAAGDNATREFHICALEMVTRQHVTACTKRAAYERRLTLVAYYANSRSCQIEAYSSITKVHAQVHSINLKCARELLINEFDVPISSEIEIIAGKDHLINFAARYEFRLRGVAHFESLESTLQLFMY